MSTWQVGWTSLALYLSLLGATVCLWPGLITRQEEARAKQLFWRFIAGHALILYFLLFCDLMLLHVVPGHPGWDHARRVGARWGWVVLYAGLIVELFRCLPPRVNAFARSGCVALLVLALTLHPTSAVTQDTGPQVYGNLKSRIYHWLGCPNYPHQPMPTRWQSFQTRDEAERAGYRAAKNCGKEKH